MSVLFRLCAAFFLLTLLGNASAEGNCPPGYYPTSGPQSPVQGCAPIPNESSSAWTGQAATNSWGAIAIDLAPSNVGIGVSVAAKSKRQATREALSNCRAKGGKACKINLTYSNQCAVVIAGVPYSKAQAGPTVEVAAAHGLRLCEDAGAAHCQIYYKACSLPEQVH